MEQFMQVVCSMLIYAACLTNILIPLFAYLVASGPWEKEIIKDVYFDFKSKDRAAWIVWIINILAIASVICLIIYYW